MTGLIYAMRVGVSFFVSVSLSFLHCVLVAQTETEKETETMHKTLALLLFILQPTAASITKAAVVIVAVGFNPYRSKLASDAGLSRLATFCSFLVRFFGEANMYTEFGGDMYVYTVFPAGFKLTGFYVV
jgi:hypothetical protein